ncbi:MAG: hypothetical protein JRL30_14355 [Deltaproteobacteria bacterium]|nr:hypothetical protein [Deltaproteobacteria bacterium]
MKKPTICIIASVFFIYPFASFASYVIHLKDGQKFLTEQYVEEGDQIKFKRYGGIIGIRKDLVREIEVIEEVKELPEEEKPPENEPKTDKPAAGQETTETEASNQGSAEADKNGKEKEEEKEREKPVEVSEDEKKKAEQEKAAKIDAFLEEKGQVMREMEIAASAFKEAKARNDREKKNQYWAELLSLQKRLGKLRERVMAEHEGKLPSWWDSIR